MYSVTKRISMIKQPRGGYINKKELVVTQLDDGITLNESKRQILRLPLNLTPLL